MSDVPTWGDQLRDDGARAIEWAATYLDTLERRPVLARTRPGEIRSRLPRRAPREPESFQAVLDDLDGLVDGITHWQHPRFLAYFATSSPPQAVAAEIIAATLNQVAILWRTSPLSTELEAVCASWLLDLLGLPPTWHGHIEDTASTSTLAALAAARSYTGKHVIACSTQAHSSVQKAARLLDMQVRPVEVDDAFRMRADLLETALSDGAVAAVVATVGTTSTTSVDPVAAIADLCAAAGAWLHVDAAYAGSSWVSPAMRWSADGVERADSLVMNPHKWMFVPMDCSVLFTARPEILRAAFTETPEYLRTPEDVESLSEYGPALGRRFRALKLWTVMRCFGQRGLQEHIERAIDLAQQLAGWVEADPAFEICAPHPFSTVCFRLIGTDAQNAAIVERVNASGDAFISHTKLNGRYVLRVAIGHMRTTRQDVMRAWDAIRTAAAA